MKPDRKTKTFETLTQISESEEQKLLKKIQFVRNNRSRLLDQIQKLQEAQQYYQTSIDFDSFNPDLLLNQRRFCTNLQNAIGSLQQQTDQLQVTIDLLQQQWIAQKSKTRGYEKLTQIHIDQRTAAFAKKEQQNTDEMALLIHAWTQENPTSDSAP